MLVKKAGWLPLKKISILRSQKNVVFEKKIFGTIFRQDETAHFSKEAILPFS